MFKQLKKATPEISSYRMGVGQKQRIAELEDCLRVIEQKLREDTAPILTLVRAFGGDETKRAWKTAICGSVTRAQVILGEKR